MIYAPCRTTLRVKVHLTKVRSLSHSDVHGMLGHTPMTTNIPGHEGIGVIVALGRDVPADFAGKRVGIKWVYSTCGKCEVCAVDDTACPYQQNSGRDVSGTLQQYIVSSIRQLTEIPAAMKVEDVAPLLCAGLTIYSAIAKANLKPNDWLVLPGAGGGLGHLGVQIANRKGYRVIAIDTGAEKRKLCIDLGATQFLDYEKDDVEASVKMLTSGYGAHAAICTASRIDAYEQALHLLRNLGTLVCIGLVDEPLPISPLQMIIRGLRLVGSSVGTAAEMRELLSMALAGEVVATVEVFDFDAAHEVLQRLARSEITGRAVLRIPQ